VQALTITKTAAAHPSIARLTKSQPNFPFPAPPALLALRLLQAIDDAEKLQRSIRDRLIFRRFPPCPSARRYLDLSRCFRERELQSISQCLEFGAFQSNLPCLICRDGASRATHNPSSPRQTQTLPICSVNPIHILTHHAGPGLPLRPSHTTTLRTVTQLTTPGLSRALPSVSALSMPSFSSPLYRSQRTPQPVRSASRTLASAP
jgi:hypothetical protein